jgi:hypothetical protein
MAKGEHCEMEADKDKVSVSLAEWWDYEKVVFLEARSEIVSHPDNLSMVATKNFHVHFAIFRPAPSR